MTSNPPGECCIQGVKHEGTAKGHMEMIGDVEAYFSYPESGDNTYGILLLPDIIGHDFINAKLIADQFAANGYFVVMPDQFHGDALPLNRPFGSDLSAWLQGPPGHLPNRVDPVVEASIQEMRRQGCKKIGGAGYCFGAKYVCRYLATGKIDVGYMAHPSFVSREELEGIKGPLAIAASEIDHTFSPEKRHESEEILSKGSQPWQLYLYSGCVHGFALRGDITKDIVKFAKEQAFLQAVTWFNQHLGKK